MKNTKSQTGRSMIEMLGVLAIIGVLSVGGLVGYTKAMRKHQLDELIYGMRQTQVEAQSRPNLDKVYCRDVFDHPWINEDCFCVGGVCVAALSEVSGRGGWFSAREEICRRYYPGETPEDFEDCILMAELNRSMNIDMVGNRIEVTW